MDSAIHRESAPLLPVERLTVDQYEAMLAKGILEEGAPIELLDGLLVRKDRAARGKDPMTVDTQHALAVKKIARLAAQFEKQGCHLGIHTPVRLAASPSPTPASSSGSPRTIYAGGAARAREQSVAIAAGRGRKHVKVRGRELLP